MPSKHSEALSNAHLEYLTAMAAWTAAQNEVYSASIDWTPSGENFAAAQKREIAARARYEEAQAAFIALKQALHQTP